VEILVAMAVLSIMGLVLAQVLSLSLQTWQQGRVRAGCYTKARVVLDTVTADIQRGVFRPDLKNFSASSPGGVPSFTFYTRAAGISTGAGAVRPVSLVTYQLSTNANLQGYLLRSGNTIEWSPTSNLNFLQQLTPVVAAPAVDPPNDLLSTGVVDFEMIFLLADGTTVLAKDYTSPTASPVVMIGVAVAVMDDGVMTQLQASSPGNFAKIQNLLETALLSTPMTLGPTGTTYVSSAYYRSIKDKWDQNLTSLYEGTTYPKAVAAGFKTFEQFVPCTPFN
jgi:hypothetical protein